MVDEVESGGSIGILIDLKLAKELGGESSESRHRTGTMEFMAIEMLRRHFNLP